MCKLRSTHLRDTRPNRRNSCVPYLQCGDYRSDYLYVTSSPIGATLPAPCRSAFVGWWTVRQIRQFELQKEQSSLCVRESVAFRVIALDRRFQLQKRCQLFVRTHASAQLSRDQTHRELVYRSLEFHERSQLFIGAENEMLSVIAMRVSNPDRSPVNIKS